jgi:hypothetical protein
MIVEDLTALLVGNAGVSALVGTRVYLMILPEGAVMPAIRYIRVARTTVDTMEGTSYCGEKFQIECLADDPKTVELIAQAVRTLVNFTGTQGATSVHKIDIDDERNAPWDSESLHYRTDLDIKIWHQNL